MSSIYRAQDPAALREAAGEPDLTGVTVWDADFPSEAGQQFVTAELDTSTGFIPGLIDLTEPRWSDLSAALHEEAALVGETVKFCLEL